jgi:hypothetical protein
VTLEHYAYLLTQEKNFAEGSKRQALAVKFPQQLKEMSVPGVKNVVSSALLLAQP